jgi:hypothetical protein
VLFNRLTDLGSVGYRSSSQAGFDLYNPDPDEILLRAMVRGVCADHETPAGPGSTAAT